MGYCEKRCFSIYPTFILAVIFTTVLADDRCKDESFCRAYCLSTNPDTVSARCGRDLASCICITPENHAVKVRFIEERTPVPPTPPTTPRPASLYHNVEYVNSQSLPNGQYNYNGNSNSIANTHHQQQQPQSQRQLQNQMTPVLLECDASETSTRMCHLFCTMEIRAWYGLCNITSKACACFGIPLSAVQEEPIAAIFHSTAPATPAPSTTPKPTYSPPLPGYQQLYPVQQHLQHQQQWRPLQTTNYESLYNNNQFYPASAPTVLNAAATDNVPQSQEQVPVRSAASLFGPNGQPVSASISTPDHLDVTVKGSTALPPSVSVESEQSTQAENLNTENVKNSSEFPGTFLKQTRKRRSINDTPIKKGSGKNFLNVKAVSSQGECSKYKCAISCKKNNYLAPDCEPQCIDDQCWCECFPRL